MPSNDLASLMQYAPTVGAGFIGTNQAQAEQMEQMKQAELAQLISSRSQDQQFKAQEQPYTLDRLGLANDTTRAQVPGFQAESRTKGYAADRARDTLDSSVDADNTTARMKIYSQIGAHLGSMSDAIGDNPTTPPHAVLAQQLNDLGIPPNTSAGILKKYAGVPPDQLATRLKADSDKIMRETEDYARTIDPATLQTDASILNEGVRSRAGIEQAHITADGRIQARVAANTANNKTEEQILRQSKTALETYQHLINFASAAAGRGDDTQAQDYIRRAQDIQRTAQAELDARSAAKGGTVATGQVAGLPTNPGAQLPPPSVGGATAPDNPTTTPTSVPDQAKAAWGNYDPIHYDYRMGPNGKLQRKAK